MAEPERGHRADFERWNGQLHRTNRGEVRDVLYNAALILRGDPAFQGRLRFNTLLEAAESRDLPWRPGSGWETWNDADDLFLAEWAQKRLAYLKPATCGAAVQIVARDEMHHPVRQWLEGLTWDGTKRLSLWPRTYLGASDTPYSRAVGRAWTISAAARVFQPGCKADHAMFLEGLQGVGKSTAAAILAVESAWFADEIADLGSKDSAQDLQGKWIIELGELSAMRRSDVERGRPPAVGSQRVVRGEC
jgi:predicted P-loop ATPase